MNDAHTNDSDGRRLAYFSGQAVVEGQDSWAAVMEVVGPIERAGWRVDLYCPTYAPGKYPGAAERLWRILGTARRLNRVLGSYDAVYVRAHPLAWPVSRAAHRAGLPVVQECNGSWADALAAWPWVRLFSPLVTVLQRTQYRIADRIIAVSGTIAEWLVSVTGRNDIVVSPNGANADLFRPGLPRPDGLPDRYVVFFGQFAPWQRLEVLFAALARAEWPDGVDLVVAGDGALRPLVEAAAAADSRIHYLGQIPYAQVPAVVGNALAATVLTYAPARAGYSPLKLYEAMACGVPVICSDTPGQAEYVREERCGVIVPPEDPAAVAAAAAELARDTEGARAMGARGRTAVEERYSWEARALQRLGVVEDAIAHTR